MILLIQLLLEKALSQGYTSGSGVSLSATFLMFVGLGGYIMLLQCRFNAELSWYLLCLHSKYIAHLPALEKHIR